MVLTKCSENDVDELQQIARETFNDTFFSYIPKEDIDYYFATALSKETLLSEIANTFSTFYFANKNGEIIGYMKVNEAPAQTELNDIDSLELQRIYLRKHRLGNREGQYLLDHAINIAKEKQKDYLWLGVWENNFRALNFYKRNGFYPFSEHFFVTGNDKSRDILMRKDFA